MARNTHALITMAALAAILGSPLIVSETAAGNLKSKQLGAARGVKALHLPVVQSAKPSKMRKKTSSTNASRRSSAKSVMVRGVKVRKRIKRSKTVKQRSVRSVKVYSVKTAPKKIKVIKRTVRKSVTVRGNESRQSKVVKSREVTVRAKTGVRTVKRGLPPVSQAHRQMTKTPRGVRETLRVFGGNASAIREAARLRDVRQAGSQSAFSNAPTPDATGPFGSRRGSFGGAQAPALGDPKAPIVQSRADSSPGGADKVTGLLNGVPGRQGQGNGQGSSNTFGSGFANPSSMVPDRSGQAGQDRGRSGGRTVRLGTQIYNHTDKSWTEHNTARNDWGGLDHDVKVDHADGSTTHYRWREDDHGNIMDAYQADVSAPDEEGWREGVTYRVDPISGEKTPIATEVAYDPDSDGQSDTPDRDRPDSQPVPDGNTGWGSGFTYCGAGGCRERQSVTPSEMLGQPARGGERDGSSSSHPSVAVKLRQDMVTNPGDSTVDFTATGNGSGGGGGSGGIDPCVIADCGGEGNPDDPARGQE